MSFCKFQEIMFASLNNYV